MTPLPHDRRACAARNDTTTTKPPFGCVVTAHGAMVLKLCRAVLDPRDADQAWIDAFRTAMGAYPRLPDGASVPAWLSTIAERTIDNVLIVRRHNGCGHTASPSRSTHP